MKPTSFRLFSRLIFSGLTLFAFFLLIYATPTANAQTTPRPSGTPGTQTTPRSSGTATTVTPGATATTSKYTDTPDDVFKNLGVQGYYVSQGAKDSMGIADIEQKLAQTLKKLKDKKHDLRIAVLSERIIGDAAESKGGSAYEYAEFMRKTLKPVPEAVIVLVIVPQGGDKLGIAENKLEVAENSALAKDGISELEKKGYADGLTTVAEKTADKISSKSGEWIQTVLIIVVIIVIIVVLVGLALAFPAFGEALGSSVSSSSEFS